MWREAFQSVADDVDRLSREVENRVAEDPLGSIAMARPEKPSPSKGKGPQKSVGASSLTSSKRQRKYEEERAAAVDPFARRRTRPKSYWSVGQEPESTAEVCVPELLESRVECMVERIYVWFTFILD